MELESSVTQGTELYYLYEEPYWSDERENVVVQPIPFECTPVQVCVPSEQSPASGNVLRGQEVGRHCYEFEKIHLHKLQPQELYCSTFTLHVILKIT